MPGMSQYVRPLRCLSRYLSHLDHYRVRMDTHTTRGDRAMEISSSPSTSGLADQPDSGSRGWQGKLAASSTRASTARAESVAGSMDKSVNNIALLIESVGNPVKIP